MFFNLCSARISDNTNFTLLPSDYPPIQGLPIYPIYFALCALTSTSISTFEIRFVSFKTQLSTFPRLFLPQPSSFHFFRGV